MRHVSIFGDDLETGNGFCVAHDVVEVDGAVFLDPVVFGISNGMIEIGEEGDCQYQGSS